jgi:hypothetical protein
MPTTIVSGPVDPSTSENIIANITELQDMEKQLINSLDTNPSFTAAQKQDTIAKIKQISTIRANLYATVGNLNDNYADKLSTSQNILGDQMSAIQIIENELAASRDNLQEMEDIKNNTQRMIEINSYFGAKYAEYSNLMKIIVFMLIPIIILAILNRYNLLPTNIYYVLVGIVALIASIYLWPLLFSIWSRNNMEYNTYDWYFSTKDAPVPGKSLNSPWITGLPSTCIGERCCTEGMSWDSTLGQCILSTTTSSASPTTLLSSVVPSTVKATESFGNMLGQKRNFLFRKPDVMLGGDSISPHNPSRFIRY